MKSHALLLGDKEEGRRIHYIVHRGEIFLDKCDAFSSLGRLYIVRCADYRKADRIISSHSMKPSDEFLYESTARQILEATTTSILDVEKGDIKKGEEKKSGDIKGRDVKAEVIPDTPLANNPLGLLKRRKKFNRRTHITLKAFKALIESGFTDSSKYEQLKTGIENLYTLKDSFIKQCPNAVPDKFNVLNKSKHKIENDEKGSISKGIKKSVSNPSSSSGIESGNSSDIGSCEGSENSEEKNILKQNCDQCETIKTEKDVVAGLTEVKSCSKSDSSFKTTKENCKSGKNDKNANGKHKKEQLGKDSAIHSCRLLGRDVCFIIMYDEIYLDLKAISNFFLCNKEIIPALMRKKSKHLHFEHPPFFPPRRFTKHSKNYVSLTCLATLVSKDLVKPIAGKKNQLLDDFKLILSNDQINDQSSHTLEKNIVVEDQTTKEEAIDHSTEEKKLSVGKKRKTSVEEKSAIPSKKLKPSSSLKQSIKNTSSVNILGNEFEIQVARNTIFLDKVAIFQLFKVTKSYHKHSNSTYRSIDRLLDRAKLSPDEAFLFEGRKRKYISIQALVVLIEQRFLTLLDIDGWCADDGDKKLLNKECDAEEQTPLTKAFLARLEEVERSTNLLENKQTLKLASFNKIEFRQSNQTLFLKTLHYMQAVGFSTNYVYRDSPSKAYFVLARLLKSRGLNLNACFLQHHKAKYGYISVYAAMVLFKTDFGPFKDKKRILRLKKELNNALTDQGFVYNGKWVKSKMNQRETDKEGSPSDFSTDSCALGHEGKKTELAQEGCKYIQIGASKFKYRIKGGNKLFIHRKSCFEAIGIEQAILSCTRGYTSNRGFSGINNILKAARIDTDACYLKGKQEQYAYISLEAVMVLLDSEDPLLVCLENKQDFADSLLSSLQEGVANILNETDETRTSFPITNMSIGGEIDERKVPFKFVEGKIFLRRDICYEISGILEKRQIDKTQKLSTENGGSTVDANPSNFLKPMNEIEDEARIISDRGLDVASSFYKDGNDEFAYVSINALLVQTSLDGEISRVTDWTNSSKFFGLGIWSDLIAAITHEAPKLKIHVKMIEFREQLINTIITYFIKHLNQEDENKRKLCLDNIKTEVSLDENVEEAFPSGDSKVTAIIKKHVPRHSRQTRSSNEEIISLEPNPRGSITDDTCSVSVDEIHVEGGKIKGKEYSTKNITDVEKHLATSNIEPHQIEEVNPIFVQNANIAETNDEDKHPLESMISEEVFQSIREEIQESCQHSGKNVIGDWLVERCDEQEINLVVNPGYGGSRKMSFIQPDVWAILRYQVIFSTKPSSDDHPENFVRHLCLLINDRKVPSDLVQPVLTKSLKKGVFNLLYNLLILRPCFGSFNPELVETFEQGTTNSYNGTNDSIRKKVNGGGGGKMLDTNFIGSSQNGRTYAGTVRSRACRVLAESRISDTCQECSYLLGATINRSVLNTPAVHESNKLYLHSSNVEGNSAKEETVDGNNSLSSNCSDNPEGKRMLHSNKSLNEKTGNESGNENSSKTNDNTAKEIITRRPSSSYQVSINPMGMGAEIYIFGKIISN